MSRKGMSPKAAAKTTAPRKRTRTKRAKLTGDSERIEWVSERTTSLSTHRMRELQREGWDAAWKGKGMSACPYRFDPDNPTAEYDRDSAEAWLTGYVAGRTDARIHRTSTPIEERRKHGKPGIF